MVRYGRQFLGYFNSHIRFKIIFPFALLTLLVALIGIYLSMRLVSASLEERFSRQLIEAGSAAVDGLGQRERLHLATLRAIAYTEGFNDAVLTANRQDLQTLLFPLVANYEVDRVDIVGKDGRQVISIHRPPGASAVEDYTISNRARAQDWPIWPVVEKVLTGTIEEQSDKYAALGMVDRHHMLWTIGPVKRGEEVVGAILVSSYTNDLLESLSQYTFAEVTLYNLEGQSIATTHHGDEATQKLHIDPADARAMLAVEGDASLRQNLVLGGRDYDLLVGIFYVKAEPLALYSVGLQSTVINAYGTNVRNQLTLIFATALLLVFGIGYFTANAITGRVQHLMENAMAVASGDFTRRTQISSTDEIGSLARSLDDMTESLARYTSALQHRIDELIALHESSTAVNVKSGLNLEQVLRAVTTSVKGVIQGIDEVAVFLLDEKSHTLIPQASTSGSIDDFPDLAYAKHEALRALLVVTKPQVIPLSQFDSFSLNGLFRRKGRTEALIVPLIAGQETVGMLTLMPDAAYRLDEDDELLLGTLANQAAIAIKNAQLFEATQRAYEELRKLDDLKTQFINIAAHELRTPLGAMMGYASFVEKRVPPHLYGAMRFLITSTLRMRTMVDAMLTIQRLDSGTALLRLSPVDIREVFKKIVTDFQPMADLEGHTITVSLPDHLPVIKADAEKVSLILSNLLSNAIKFTPEKGQIELAAKSYLRGLLISVRDNGVGIAPEDQDKIFERFYQARAAHLAGHGGMGLGLTIIKHLVELHQGQVWVESQVGQGSTFFFTLPDLPSLPPGTEPVTEPQGYEQSETVVKIV